MISFRNVSKSYNEGMVFAVRNFSLEVEAGEFLVLLGTSGSGKTTTLKMTNRLIEPSSGSIVVSGRDTASQDPVELRRRIGYVFQGIGLFPHMTIAENIGVVPSLLGWRHGVIHERVDELLGTVGLPPENFRNRKPEELSGGQQQRVGVARALAARQEILLMDEPFGALDPLTRDALQTEFKTLHTSLGFTVVMVTHDMTEALLLADRIGVMENGRLVGLGTPHELLSNPGNDRVKALMETPKRQAEMIEKITRGADAS